MYKIYLIVTKKVYDFDQKMGILNLASNISLILKLANSFQSEAKQEEWLLKCFRFLLSYYKTTSNNMELRNFFQN